MGSTTESLGRWAGIARPGPGVSVWSTVGPLDGLEARDILAFEKGMLSMAVFMADGRPYALESHCLHAGESLLDRAVDGWTVIGP